MKQKVRLLSLFFLGIVFFVFASCEEPSSDPINWGEEPPVEYIGTWKAEKKLTVISAISEISLVVDTSGEVSFTSKTDMTAELTRVVALSKAGGNNFTESQIWEGLKKNPLSDFGIPTGGFSTSPKISYSSSKLITVQDSAKYEDLKVGSPTNIIVSKDATTLTMTTTNDGEILFTKI